MSRACAVALVVLVLSGVSPAAAQDQLVTTFVPDTQRRWDVAWSVGWRGVDKSELAPEWDEWYDVAAFGFSTSRHLTPHIKIDVDLSTTTVGTVFDQGTVVTSGLLPTYYYRERQFRRTVVAPALAYQFFENRWVHPFLGVGVEGVRETERVDVEILPTRGGQPPPADAPSPRVTYSARPFLIGGVKFYVSERAFIRTDVQTTFASGGAESGVFRVGAGVDF